MGVGEEHGKDTTCGVRPGPALGVLPLLPQSVSEERAWVRGRPPGPGWCWWSGDPAQPRGPVRGGLWCGSPRDVAGSHSADNTDEPSLEYLPPSRCRAFSSRSRAQGKVCSAPPRRSPLSTCQPCRGLPVSQRGGSRAASALGGRIAWFWVQAIPYV